MPKAVVEVGAEMEVREVTVDPAEKVGKAGAGVTEKTQNLRMMEGTADVVAMAATVAAEVMVLMEATQLLVPLQAEEEML